MIMNWREHWLRAAPNTSNKSNLRPDTYNYDEAFAHIDKVLKIGFGDSVLDAGCGSGNLLVRCAKEATAITGIDISQKACAVARAQLKRAGTAGFSIDNYDILNNGYTDGVFIKVICSGLFEHMDTMEEAQKYLHALLRMTGKYKDCVLYISDIPKYIKHEELAKDYPHEITDSYEDKEEMYDLIIKGVVLSKYTKLKSDDEQS